MKAVAAQAPSPAAPQPADSSARPHRGFVHAPIRKQVMLLTLLAAFTGSLAGMAEAHLEHRGWPMILGLTIAVSLVSLLGKQWIIDPLERLIADVRESGEAQRPTRKHEAPADGGNELDHLAAFVHTISVEAYRQTRTVDQLRRTLDHRIAFATRRATQQLEQKALRDPLTGLANRRFVQDNLDALVKSCQEARSDLICIAIDMDGFKQVNDTLGHAKGDELLKFLASVIRSNIRAEDYAVRMGGDEFIIFMPSTQLADAGEVINRIRRLFTQHTRIAVPAGVSVGISAGVASMTRTGAANGALLMQRADECLYAAKGAGKGRVIGAE
jgi:diguanylate cyclase (GGDEF)-like protein